MNIYDALKKDHEEVRHLLDRLIQTSEADNDQWKEILDEIRDELIPHARAEEALFYNAIRELTPELSPDTNTVADSYAEHAAAEMELRSLQAMKAVDMNWTTLAKKLRTDILLHVKHEESKVFGLAHRVFTDEEAKMIGKAFKKL